MAASFTVADPSAATSSRDRASGKVMRGRSPTRDGSSIPGRAGASSRASAGGGGPAKVGVSARGVSGAGGSRSNRRNRMAATDAPTQAQPPPSARPIHTPITRAPSNPTVQPSRNRYEVPVL